MNIVTVFKKDGENVKYVYLCDEKQNGTLKNFERAALSFLVLIHTSESMELIPQIPASDLRHGCLSS